MEVDTLIVSDVHLGAPISRRKGLLAILKHFKYSRLILGGDILNDVRRLHRYNGEDWDVLSYVREATHKEKEITVIYIGGNHDRELSSWFGALGVKAENLCEQYMWESGGKRFLALHGDRFDFFYNANKIVSDIATWIYNFAQKSPALAHFLKHRTKQWIRAAELVELGAVLHAKANQADVVICGHTHRAKRNMHGPIEYINTGSWTEERCTLMTETAGEITLHEFRCPIDSKFNYDRFIASGTTLVSPLT